MKTVKLLKKVMKPFKAYQVKRKKRHQMFGEALNNMVIDNLIEFETQSFNTVRLVPNKNIKLFDDVQTHVTCVVTPYPSPLKRKYDALDMRSDNCASDVRDKRSLLVTAIKKAFLNHSQIIDSKELYNLVSTSITDHCNISFSYKEFESTVTHMVKKNMLEIAGDKSTGYVQYRLCNDQSEIETKHSEHSHKHSTGLVHATITTDNENHHNNNTECHQLIEQLDTMQQNEIYYDENGHEYPNHAVTIGPKITNYKTHVYCWNMWTEQQVC